MVALEEVWISLPSFGEMLVYTTCCLGYLYPSSLGISRRAVEEEGRQKSGAAAAARRTAYAVSETLKNARHLFVCNNQHQRRRRHRRKRHQRNISVA